MAPVDNTYYDLLGADPAATEAELRTAYKKKALALHPDKGGDPEDFSKMKAAYDVLSDPQKRKMYDSYGTQGISLMEGDLRPEHMMVMLTRSGKVAVVMILAAVCTAILLPVVFFALRWDEIAKWPWFCSFIPMWLLHAFSLTFVFVCIRAQTPEGEAASWDDATRLEFAQRKRYAIMARVGGTCFNSLLITFEVFFGLRAEGSVDWSWFVVVLPYIFFELALLGISVARAPASYEMRKMEAGRVKQIVPPPAFGLFVLQSIEWGTLRILTAVLMAARADEVFDASWFLCLLPVMLGGLESILSALRIKLNFRAEQRKLAAQTNQATQEDIEEPGGGIVVACCVVVFWLLMACLAAAKLGGLDVSAFIVFLPILIVVVCCFFCLPACIVINEKPPDDEAAAAAAAAGGPGPDVVGQPTAEQAAAEAALFAMFEQVVAMEAAEAERQAAEEAALKNAADVCRAQNDKAKDDAAQRVQQGVYSNNQPQAPVVSKDGVPDAERWPARMPEDVA